MEEKKTENLNNAVEISLAGKIDSLNARELEQDIFRQLEGKGQVPVILHAADLEYISSAGLRMLLHLKKTYPDITITDVSSEIYEVLQMTGFTEMMKVEKAWKEVSVEGCEIVGRGAQGTLYRVDSDTVVKVYQNADALDEIKREREMSRLALVLGIPTAISYDIVKVGDSYGSVFELLDARSFSSILAVEPEKMDWCVEQYVDMLRKIHRTEAPEGELPDMKERGLEWVKFLQDYLPEDAGKKLLRMVNELPHDNHLVHGDYHTKNLELQGEEVLLIDMETLAVGVPIFDLASMYNAFRGFSETDPDLVRKFQGFDADTAAIFWHKALAAYLGTENEAEIKKVEDKARILGYVKLIRRAIRRNGLEDETENRKILHWKEELLELLERTGTLMFTPFEMEIEADLENLHTVMDFVQGHLERAGIPVKIQTQVGLAVEEIFVNIANYAYAPGKGNAKVRAEVLQAPLEVIITFIDKGVPFDPLAQASPDLTLPAAERPIGGLGIFMARKAMDDVIYEYKDGKNILKLKKNL